MIDNSLIEHGGYLMVRHGASREDLFYDLTGFEQCLRLAAAAMSKSA